MGLGAVQATFGAFAARYLADHGAPGGPDRFIVMVGDAELDEGNVWEALLEEPLAALGTVRWIVDMFTRLWNHGVDLYLRDLHYRAYRNMSAANRIHPGFPDVERVREDCDIKHREQGYLHREEVQWVVAGLAVIAVVALAWFGGRWLAAASRRSLRRIIREELAGARADTATGTPPPA